MSTIADNMTWNVSGHRLKRLELRSKDASRLENELVRSRQQSARLRVELKCLRAELRDQAERSRTRTAGLVHTATEKERQRQKLARCVREHLTPEQWREWSSEYDQANAGLHRTSEAQHNEKG